MAKASNTTESNLETIGRDLTKLEKIDAPVLAVNSADDQVNPPELGLMEQEIAKVARGKYILIPISDQTRGHGTHSLPAIWGEYLAALLKESEPGR